MKQPLVVVQTGRITETKTPLQALARFLQSKNTIDSWHLFHPLRGAGNPYTYIYHRKKLLKKTKELPYEFVQYIREFMATFLFLLRFPKPIDVFIGMSGFDMLPAILLKRIKKIDKLIFYPIDYTDQRFSSPFLNKCYEMLDRLSVRSSTIIIYTNMRSKTIRERQGATPNQLQYVPNGIFLVDLPTQSKPGRSTHRNLYYVGYLDSCHGIQQAIKAFSGITSVVPQCTLTIIGSGPDEKYLRAYVSLKNLNHRVRLIGSLPHKKILSILSQGGIGLAPYARGSRWVYYCDSTKIKEYLACGLPVITSNATEASNLIGKHDCGGVFQNFTGLKKWIIKLTTDRSLYLRFSHNARLVGRQFDYNQHYNRLFDNIDTHPI